MSSAADAAAEMVKNRRQKAIFFVKVGSPQTIGTLPGYSSGKFSEHPGCAAVLRGSVAEETAERQFLTRKFYESYNKRHPNAIEKKAFYAAQEINKTGRAELVNEYPGLLYGQTGSRRRPLP